MLPIVPYFNSYLILDAIQEILRQFVQNDIARVKMVCKIWEEICKIASKFLKHNQKGRGILLLENDITCTTMVRKNLKNVVPNLHKIWWLGRLTKNALFWKCHKIWEEISEIAQNLLNTGSKQNQIWKKMGENCFFWKYHNSC